MKSTIAEMTGFLMTGQSGFREGSRAVAPRRAFLRAAGAAALASACGPRFAAAQTFTATSISQAAQDARRDVGRLARRADDLLRATAADGAERGRNAIGRFRADGASLSRDLATIFNGGVSEDDWLLVVPTRQLDLALTIRPLLIRLAPTKDEVEAALKLPLPEVNPAAGESAEDVVLAIIVRALGLPRNARLAAALKDDKAFAAALTAAAEAVKGRRYGLAALELQRLMETLMLPRAIATLAEYAGPDGARTTYRALVVRFVPFVGWSYFTSLLLASIYLNRDTNAPVLR